MQMGANYNKKMAAAKLETAQAIGEQWSPGEEERTFYGAI